MQRGVQSPQQASPDAHHKSPATHDPALSDEALVQRALDVQGSQVVYSPAMVRALSRVVGNKSAQRIVQRTFGQVGMTVSGRSLIQRDPTQAGTIANGHAWEKHRNEGPFRRLADETEFAAYIKDVMENPEGTKDLARGRKAYYKGKVIVVYDPTSRDKGTCFVSNNAAKRVSKLT